MKKKIRIAFSGFAPYHDPHQQAYWRFLCDRYDVEEVEDPDYVIDGGLTYRHLKYNAVKILIDGENLVPDFNDFDYAIGSTELTFGDRYLRSPWFVFYPHFSEIANRKTTPDPALLSRKFCSFVVSNAEFGDPMRRKFFEALSKYKRVDSGGKYRNNIGGPVVDKLSFCRDYKFNIAFENSSFPGYTTEKIMDAYVAQSVPIYYGNPHVETDFLPSSMIRVANESDIERAVSEIIRLDRDDDAYMKMVTAPCLTRGDYRVYEKELEAFLAHVFDQPLESAIRLCPHGQQQVMRRHLKYVHTLDQRLRDSRLFKCAAWVSSKIHSES